MGNIVNATASLTKLTAPAAMAAIVSHSSNFLNDTAGFGGEGNMSSSLFSNSTPVPDNTTTEYVKIIDNRDKSEDYSSSYGIRFEEITISILVFLIVSILIGLVSLVGNALVLRAWLKYRKLRTDFYTTFLAISVADVLFVIVQIPSEIQDRLYLAPYTATWCKTAHYIANASSFIVAALIVVLAVLRAILLTNRNAVSRPNAKHLLIVCALLYLVIFVTSQPMLSVWDVIEGICIDRDVMETRTNAWIVNLCASVVPLGLVVVIYFLTYLFGKRFFADSYSPREREKSRLVNCIIIAFAIFQVPYRVANIYGVEEQIEDEQAYMNYENIKDYMLCFMLIDKAIRPVLYSKLATDLGQAFDEFVNCRTCSKTYTVPPILKTRRANQHCFHPTVNVVSADNDPLSPHQYTESLQGAMCVNYHNMIDNGASSTAAMGPLIEVFPPPPPSSSSSESPSSDNSEMTSLSASSETPLVCHNTLQVDVESCEV